MAEMNGSHRAAAVTPEEHQNDSGVTTAPRSSSSGSKPRRRRKMCVSIKPKNICFDYLRGESSHCEIRRDALSCRFAVSTQWEQEVAERRAPKDFHTYFCCCARRIGHMFALLSYPDGTPIIIAGPCWPFCLFVTCK